MAQISPCLADGQRYGSVVAFRDIAIRQAEHDREARRFRYGGHIASLDPELTERGLPGFAANADRDRGETGPDWPERIDDECVML